MEKEIDRFDATAGDGSVYTIVVIQEYIDASSTNKPDQWKRSMKRLELLDGRLVTAVDASTFKIFQTDEIIRKIS